ncbi:hypothetical protein LOTGIDRAFT_154709 [Lottia gigantea]|uniref:Uncharacterized protein n=1 Tax=Lottia gigantea TaxID=225164 RepID=V4A1N4_LOTGI|nr:hypothetical protein LOTGIDRAFT_154709 [Lottia gigantea]ESO87206.1 hypothetical protein LOTGIDRAFT_154709 [Lottia gigantea]
MFMMKTLSLMCLVALLSTCTALNEIKIEVENIATDESYTGRIYPRSNASGLRTVRIMDSNRVEIFLCIDDEETFQVADVSYSTDGFSDEVNVILDNHEIGQFTTHSESNGGLLWNEFHHTGEIGQEFRMIPGEHNLTIALDQLNELGVELDFLLLRFSRSTTEDEVLCSYHSYSHISPDLTVGVEP